MRTILLYSVLFVFTALINAQTISNGLYVNKERNEFVIVRNDTVQFRFYNDDAFASFTIGEGLLKIGKIGKYGIQTFPTLIEETATLQRQIRNDDKVSIQALALDSLPIPFAWIKISQLQCRASPVVAYTDTIGQLFLNKEQVGQLSRKVVSIHVTSLGYTPTKKKVQLEKGYDYIIRMRIPDILSGSVASDNEWSIEVLNENEILLVRKNAATRRRNRGREISTTKLRKISNDYFHSDFPFDKDMQALCW